MNKIFLFFIAAILLTGCQATKQAGREEPVHTSPQSPKKTAGPDLVLKVASINLARISKRIERKDIEELTDSLRKEKIDVLTLQGVSRYPGVASRLDVIDELSARSEMRQVFGETISLSGKEAGNAVLSVYPIKSSENTHYYGLQSPNFEAALQAVIDCGVRDAVVISTGLPERASVDDQNTVANKLSALSILYINDPLIVTGNLPASDALRKMEQFETLKPLNNIDAPRIWFSGGGSIKLISQKVGRTSLGTMTIAELGLFRKPKP